MSSAVAATAPSAYPRVRTLHQLRTQLNADSVEFLPQHEGAAAEEDSAASNLRTFVVGNYQLDEVSRVKSGRIYLYQLQRADNDGAQHEEEEEANALVAQASESAAPAAAAATAASASAASAAAAASPVAPVSVSSTSFPLLQSAVLDTAAIFDLKWAPRLIDGRTVLASADADGVVKLYDFAHATAGGRAGLAESHSTHILPKASCLSVAWSPACDRLAVSGSDSSCSVWSLTPAGLAEQSRWTAHEFEAWIVSFDAHRPDVVYTGADDSKFRGWDLRVANSVRSATFTDSTTHGAGVCTIQSHPTREHMLATGSYDESLRIWDVRHIRTPVLEHALGGGVWRVRWRPVSAGGGDTLLACTMHDGFKIVALDFGAESADSTAAVAAAAVSADSAKSAPAAVSCRTTVHYRAHASLAYGADWCAQPLRSAAFASPRNLIASCSFYDKQVNVWTCDRP